MNLKTLQLATNGALVAQRELHQTGSADHIGAWIDVANLVLVEAKARGLTSETSDFVKTLETVDQVNGESFKYAKELHHKVKAAVIKAVFGE